MNVLITGGSGFVGRHLRQGLSASLNLYSLSRISHADDRFQLACDLSARESVMEALAPHAFDVVIHGAGLAHDDKGIYQEADYFRVNALGTKHLLDALAVGGQTKLFVLLSSVNVYGEWGREEPVDESTEPQPVTPYAKSKLQAEKFCREQRTVPFVILRMASLYGPDFSRNLLKRVQPIGGRMPLRSGSGMQQVSFCSVFNVVDLIGKLLDLPETFNGEIFNVVDDQAYSMRALHAFCRQQFHVGRPLVVPKWLVDVAALGGRLLMPSQRETIKSLYWKFAHHTRYANSKLQTKLEVKQKWDLYNTFGNGG